MSAAGFKDFFIYFCVCSNYTRSFFHTFNKKWRHLLLDDEVCVLSLESSVAVVHGWNWMLTCQNPCDPPAQWLLDHWVLFLGLLVGLNLGFEPMTFQS